MLSICRSRFSTNVTRVLQLLQEGFDILYTYLRFLEHITPILPCNAILMHGIAGMLRQSLGSQIV
jgi:hypothetical protein